MRELRKQSARNYLHFPAWPRSVLQQALEASENYVCAPQSRLQCISELRNVIHHCRDFSGKFLEELDLKSADEYANTAILEMADENQLDIREDQVEVQALKALWQFMFIHRSESLRNLALSHLDTMNKLISSSKYLSATAAARSTLFQLLRHILNTKKITVKLQDVEVNRESYGEKSNIQKVFEGGAGVEDLERLKAQAEFMLNQLYRLKKLPEDRRFLMKILCEMADIIGREANESPKKPPNKRPKSLKDELEGDVDDNEGDENQEQRVSYDFEVFEGEIGDQVEHKVDNRLENEVDINSPMRVTSLRDELKAALTKRKADFDQRQLAALARLKNCTVEEVIRQEMERKNVAAPVQPQERVVYAPQQRLNISAADLMAAMKSRPKIDALGDIEE
ncbi:unnamed protein product [Bursaphelenchus xylophilus]|uniref:(pine wood nematode) hypothetical protein n=1 Tax=Bursaphelenchus xylophilus TaxID=6326 RepID=A0A1I7RUM0_BURXY|nr:unnamed protein product [Bursaphelenchus xylophilus]CAG9114213.1 unnamed protein product [Bursaphelenchus xylophilus]